MLRAEQGEKMERRTKNMTTSLIAVSLAALSGWACAPAATTSNDGGACDEFTNYTATVTQSSFATDVFPILSNANAPSGCGQAVSCHGNPPAGLDKISGGTKFLQFVFDPPDMAMVKAELLTASVNAPSMQRVVPGNVGQSFMAYKLAKDATGANRSGLACVNMMCMDGASVGNNHPCGDLMPSLGSITPGDRTKILDWIKLGAAN
jgi:hypothetical protein